MINVDLNFPIQYTALFDPDVDEIVEASGRITAKSTSNEIRAIMAMLEDKKNNIWYCRAEKEDIRNKNFASMWSLIEKYSLSQYFINRLNPCEITCLKTGAKCYFSGINGKTADDTLATKGFNPQGGTFFMCILDEADEVKSPDHITAWESTANRFMLPHSKMVYAYNPPMSKSHWAHKFFGDKIKNGATKIYATWEDIRGLLNEKTIRQIEKFKADQPEYYKYWYLGEPISYKGMVYPMFNRKQHCRTPWEFFKERDTITELVIGLDEGTTFDSTCCTALAIWQSGRAMVMDCLEIDPVITGISAPTKTSERIYKWADELLRVKMPYLAEVPRKWIFECAEAGQLLMAQFVADYGEDCQRVTNKSIPGDIKRVSSMLADGVLYFYDDPTLNTTHTLIEDIEDYIYDDITGLPKKRQRDDTIDSLEYATKLYYNVPLRTFNIGG